MNNKLLNLKTLLFMTLFSLFLSIFFFQEKGLLIEYLFLCFIVPMNIILSFLTSSLNELYFNQYFINLSFYQKYIFNFLYLFFLYFISLLIQFYILDRLKNKKTKMVLFYYMTILSFFYIFYIFLCFIKMIK